MMRTTLGFIIVAVFIMALMITVFLYGSSPEPQTQGSALAVGKTKPLELSIWTPKANYLLHEAVIAHVRLRNVGDNPVRLIRFRLCISHNVDGVEVTKKRLANIFTLKLSPKDVVGLEPGQAIETCFRSTDAEKYVPLKVGEHWLLSTYDTTILSDPRIRTPDLDVGSLWQGKITTERLKFQVSKPTEVETEAFKLHERLMEVESEVDLASGLGPPPDGLITEGRELVLKLIKGFPQSPYVASACLRFADVVSSSLCQPYKRPDDIITIAQEYLSLKRTDDPVVVSTLAIQLVPAYYTKGDKQKALQWLAHCPPHHQETYENLLFKKSR